VVEGKLDNRMIEWDERAAVCVVLAAGGYPGAYEKGLPISGLDKIDQLESVVVFQAGTKLEGRVVANGGRVLGVTALGDNIKFAVQKAYQAVDLIKFKGMHYRKDIGKKALKYF
jgi:phosphoribosylamine--glycine ligase